MASNAQRDYYDVLGVTRDADEKTIKNAFRRLALKYHPDRSKEPDAVARFKEIAEAYAVLSDPRRRADYDTRGFAGVAGISPEDLFAGIDFGDLFGGIGFGTGGGLFERLFNQTGRHGPPRGRDIEVVVTIPLSAVLTGSEETVTISRPGPCDACGGTGARVGSTPRPCEPCGGTGQCSTTSRQGNVLVRKVTTCTSCGGRGTIIDDPCPDCDGSGQFVHSDSVKVQIPPGIDEDTALRIPGHGMPAPDSRGVPGDAYVIVETAADPRFVRRGADLWCGEEIDVPDAVLGTVRRVPTLDGEVAVTVEPGTQPGTTLRVAGKGLPRIGAARGDLLVNLAVRIPQHVSHRDRLLWEQLRSVEKPRGHRPVQPPSHPG